MQAALELFKAHIVESIETKKLILESMPEAMLAAGQALHLCLKSHGKILSCGNGGSANDAQHFATELVNRFEMERAPLAAIALNTDASLISAIGKDYHFDQIYAKQILALGQAKDILIAISTSGQSGNILAAIKAAHSKNMQVILLSGREGGLALQELGSNDLSLIVPVQRTARIQECHLLILHSLCDYIDHAMMQNY